MTSDNNPAFDLLPDERIEWSAQPDWSRAARPPRRRWALVRLTALALLMSVIAVFVIHASEWPEPESLGRAVFAIAILVTGALTIYLWIKAASATFALFERPAPRPEAAYALTSHRLMVTTGNPTTTQTVTSANYLLEATLRPNGQVHDLLLWFGPRGHDEYYEHGEPLVLYALADGATAKKEIIARFGPPKWQPRSAET